MAIASSPILSQGMVITVDEAKKYSLENLTQYEAALAPLKVSFNENEFITLILFVFSVGVIGFKNSILRKKLYKDIFDLVPSELMK